MKTRKEISIQFNKQVDKFYESFNAMNELRNNMLLLTIDVDGEILDSFNKTNLQGAVDEIQSSMQKLEFTMRKVEGELEKSVYPFQEGDDYWTIEGDRVVYGCWDETSEEDHDKNPYRKYLTEAEALDLFRAEDVRIRKFGADMPATPNDREKVFFALTWAKDVNGKQGVYDLTDAMGIEDRRYCTGCESEEPHLGDECCVCGTINPLLLYRYEGNTLPNAKEHLYLSTGVANHKGFVQVTHQGTGEVRQYYIVDFNRLFKKIV